MTRLDDDARFGGIALVNGAFVFGAGEVGPQVDAREHFHQFALVGVDDARDISHRGIVADE